MHSDKNQEKRAFVNTTEEEIEQLLVDSKAKNTNRSTQSSVRRLNAFLKLRELPQLEDLDDNELPSVLLKFYTDVRKIKEGEQYQTSSFKVLRAGLNRYFKVERNIDIVADERFLKTNLVFDGMQVKAKKEGKGTVHSTPHISDTDLIKIGHYFNVDHVTSPDPYILQHTVQFYLMYFFCRRGQENLYDMTKDHFELITENTGEQYVVQKLDEKDKNHGVQQTELANQGKMYSDASESIFG